MTIYRDRKEIELTNEECRKVYDKLDREYKVEDIKSRLEILEVELDNVDELVDRFEHAIGNNDSFWDSYWYSMDYVIEEYLKEKKVQ